MCVAPTPEQLVETAMTLAAEAGRRGDPPFGALLVSPHGEVVAMASNRQVSGGDPTAHAEIELLRAAARDGHRPPLRGYTVVVNAEPCSMCASALVKTEVGSLIYGASHEPHMDPDLDAATVFAAARRPPRVTAGVLAGEAAAAIASFRAVGRLRRSTERSARKSPGEARRESSTAMDPIRLGLSIRALRRRRGWTQAELGERGRLLGLGRSP